jgi:hypothetical protein
MKIKFISLISIASILLLYSCKREVDPCMKLVNPPEGATTGTKPTFSWIACIPTNSTTVYLSGTAPNCTMIQDTQISTSNQLTWHSVLPYGYTFTWFVRNGNVQSPTDTFFTGYPDSLLIGTYHVTASYQYITFVPPGPPMNNDSIYGQTNVTLREVSAGELLFNDASLTHQQMNESYNSFICPPTQYPIIYGNIYDSWIQFTGDSITAYSGYSSLEGFTGYIWNGTKVQ